MPKKAPAQKVQFDPRKSYSWQSQDVFAITGAELDVLHKAFNAVISQPEAQKYILAMEGAKITTSIIAKYVEEGVIKEAEA